MSITQTVESTPVADIMTTARKIMPGDILLSRTGRPMVLVTRAETRHTGRKVTRVSGEWLVERPNGAPPIFRQTVGASAPAAVRRTL